MFRRILIMILLAMPLVAGPIMAHKKYAPVPAGANGPPIPKKGYLVEEIRGGVYWVTEGVYQALFVTTGEGVIVVDAPPTIGKNLLKAVKETTSEPIKYFVYTHQHKDHVGMAAIMPKGTIFVGHEKVAARLKAANDPNRPVPSITFSDQYTLTLGNQRMELANKGRSHEDGSTYVYFPKQKVLMLVDVIFPGWVPFKDMALAKSVSGFIKAHDHVLAYDFDTFVGGHLTRLGNRKDVEVAKEYILDVMANAGKALQSVNFMEIAQKTGFQNRWALFKTYLDAVAEHCAQATLVKWLNVLGGADVFTFDHCWIAQEHIQLDY